MSLEIVNLYKRYNQQLVLKGVSFAVKPGEIVGFLGPNGAGKSTTMKIITGSLHQDKGEVLVCGMNVKNDPIRTKKKIGYLPEHNPLYSDMYVKEYLKFVGLAHGMNRNHLRLKMEETIHLCGLSNVASKKIYMLSKGYRQRVGLAQALIHNPEVLILDEPTTGLDPNQIVEIRSMIKENCHEKMVILSTHIMQEVEAICDRAVIIHQGEVIADQSVESLKSLGDQQKLISLEVAEKVTQKHLDQLKKIDGITNIPQKSNQKYMIYADRDVRSEIYHWAVQNKLTLLELFQEENTLEEVFQHLTN